MESIKIYTDGACSGNPGISGIGIVLIYNDQIKKISKNIGHGTNNIAELQAIKVALETVKRKDIPVVIYTDSQYCIGTLTGKWKAKLNVELIKDIQKLMKTFKDIKFVKVSGHSGDKYNEMANTLAVSATQ